jgi:hypothetical protein
MRKPSMPVGYSLMHTDEYASHNVQVYSNGKAYIVYVLDAPSRKRIAQSPLLPSLPAALSFADDTIDERIN